MSNTRVVQSQCLPTIVFIVGAVVFESRMALEMGSTEKLSAMGLTPEQQTALRTVRTNLGKVVAAHKDPEGCFLRLPRDWEFHAIGM